MKRSSALTRISGNEPLECAYAPATCCSLHVAGAGEIPSTILIATSSTLGRFWGGLAAGWVALAGWSLLGTGGRDGFGTVR